MEDFDAERQLYRDAQATFSTEPGKRVLAWIKELGDFGATPYAKGDPHHTAFLCGRQDIPNRLVFMAQTPIQLLMDRIDEKEKASSDQQVHLDQQWPAKTDDWPFEEEEAQR